ncbi:hypothetical protein Nepgr_021299 [Nepenthes gracilis]|uniref:Uncharacterized protein n=1 Tax=Nepenthes gracilis TaxID=150966 RepID=A0AAD3SWK4_NEPGR|nr:hypothetical protein Nepgr_021299 [Nepenthes gracilis]
MPSAVAPRMLMYPPSAPESLIKDKKMFTVMADPLLKGKCPQKALRQALAVVAICLQEEAVTRPLISDVVTALEFLAGPMASKETPKLSVGKKKMEKKV